MLSLRCFHNAGSGPRGAQSTYLLTPGECDQPPKSDSHYYPRLDLTDKKVVGSSNNCYITKLSSLEGELEEEIYNHLSKLHPL